MPVIPNEQQCYDLLKKYKTPEHVIKHCQAVCSVAVAIGERLNQVGYNIDIPLLRASALLHDIARVHEDHEKVGAEYLSSIGYENISNVMVKHMKYKEYNSIDNIKEIDLLCIGDRTVIEDKYVGADLRMDYIENKAIRMGRAYLVEGLKKSRIELKEYISDIEKKMGITLDDLMKGIHE